MTGGGGTEPRAGADHVHDAAVWHGGYEGEREAERAQATAELIPDFGPATTVLEVGAGSGLVAEAIRARGMFVIAMDISSIALAAAGGPRVVADVLRLPFRDLSVDVAVAAEVLEHFTAEMRADAGVALAQVARSAVVVTVPFKETTSAAEARCRACGHTFQAWRHQASFDRRSASRLLTNGYRVRQVAVLGPPRPRIPRWSIALAHLLGGYYVPPAGFDTCPACGTRAELWGSGGLLVRLVRGLPRRLLPRHEGTWIGVVFHRDRPVEMAR